MDFYAYLLRCADGSYYAGSTDDIDKRFAEHQAGIKCGYTKSRLPVDLVLVERFATREEAKAFETQIKGWSRAKKEAFIERNWARLHELAVSRQVSGRVRD